MNLQMIEQSPLVLGAGELWPKATSGEFLSAIRDGNLPSALETSEPYAESIERWSNSLFVDYVAELLGICDPDPDEIQQRQFNKVLRHEREFWCMTWEG